MNTQDKSFLKKIGLSKICPHLVSAQEKIKKSKEGSGLKYKDLTSKEKKILDDCDDLIDDTLSLILNIRLYEMKYKKYLK